MLSIEGCIVREFHIPILRVRVAFQVPWDHSDASDTVAYIASGSVLRERLAFATGGTGFDYRVEHGVKLHNFLYFHKNVNQQHKIVDHGYYNTFEPIQTSGQVPGATDQNGLAYPAGQLRGHQPGSHVQSGRV